MAADADPHMLLGLLARQNGLIDQDQLLAAVRSWTRDKDRALADHLVGIGYLDPDGPAAIEAMAALHLKRHGGDTAPVLASLAAGPSTRERLASLGDHDVTESLAHLGSTTVDRGDDHTDTLVIGSASSDGHRFRVLRPHAHGGLGAVFVALDEELHREVALKQILDRHADDPASRHRFLLEAEVTGGLEHPGIVPVYGLGTYADGRPFYAMRFIRGDSLKDAIDHFHADPALIPDPGNRSLELRKLLRRFLDVCNAIGYAHSRGVLHRDIKPGNVIVGNHGETLVIDWGLAKTLGRVEPVANEAEGALAPPSASGSAETLPGSVLGTPAYMSPEQAVGDIEHVGARSDVYSLGATLYCLLTGRPPFDGNVADVLGAVQAGQLLAPRQVDPTVDRALEAVCLKAMAMAPDDRYATPRALADDIERWTADEPVSAWSEPLTHRVWRWVRKHRTLSAAAAATMLLGTMSLGVGYYRERVNAERIAAEQRETERRFDQVMKSYEDYYSGVNEEALLGQKLPRAFLDALLEKPRLFYEQLTAELAAKPRQTLKEKALLAQGRDNLGGILRILGRHAEAREQNQASVALWEKLKAAEPGVLRHQYGLARSYNRLGLAIRESGERKEAIGAYRAAIAVSEALVQARPAAPEYHQWLANSYTNLGNALRELGEPKSAAETARKAVAAAEALARVKPGVPEYQATLAKNYNNLGIVLRQTGDPKAASEAYRKSITLTADVVKAQPAVNEYRHVLANGHNNLGLVLRETGDPKAAIQAYLEAIAVCEALVKVQPAVPEYQQCLANSYANLANVLRESGEPDAAIRSSRQAIAVTEALVEAHPAVPEYQQSLARGYNNLGIVLRELGDPKRASEAYRRAITLRAALVKAHSGIPQYELGLANSYNNLGNTLDDSGELQAAIGAYRQAIAVSEALVKAQPGGPEYRQGLANTYTNLANVLRELGEPEAAIPECQKALTLREGLAKAQPNRPDFQSGLGETLECLGMALAALGRNDEAIVRYREAIGHQRAVFDRLPQLTQSRRLLSSHYRSLAASLRTQSRLREAVAAIRERIKLWPKNPTEIYNAACDFALCVPTEVDGARKEALATEAMQTLRAAVAAGWTDAAQTERKPDLAALHDRPDFRACLDDLFDRAFPGDPFAQPSKRASEPPIVDPRQ